MDIHPDAVVPQSPCVVTPTPTRVDGANSGETTAAHLRARLLKMIVENEKSRQRPSIESKPR